MYSLISCLFGFYDFPITWSVLINYFFRQFSPCLFFILHRTLLYKWVLQSKINDKTFCRLFVFGQVESCFEAHQTAVTIRYPQILSIIIQMGCRFATWLKLNKLIQCGLEQRIWLKWFLMVIICTHYILIMLLVICVYMSEFFSHCLMLNLSFFVISH